MEIVDSAYALLATRARSVAELRDRLARKGFAEDAIESCIAELVRRGYLDDLAFAESFVRDRVRFRPKGRRALEAELRAKGVARETAREAIRHAWAEEGVDEATLAIRAARAWARRSLDVATGPASGEGRQRLRRRLNTYLGRRGFSVDAARAAVAEVLP